MEMKGSVHQRKQRISVSKGYLLPLLLALLLGLAASAAAYQPPPGDPSRPATRPTPTAQEAPPREPEILQSELLPDSSLHTIVSLPAVADAYIASAMPEQNFGLGPLFLGYHLNGDPFGAERILMRFDLSSIPDGAVVNQATLRLRSSLAIPENDAPMDTVLRRLTTVWQEDTVTWNTEPTWGEVRANAAVGAALDWYEWDVTGLVADWAGDIHTNNGLEIIGDERIQHRERAFYSRETGTNLFPRLIVDYTDVGDDQPPVVTVDPLPAFSPRTFTVSWSGADQGPAGIEHYDVQYRVNLGEWFTWRSNVTITEDEFVGGESGWLYQFRARGVDQAGNVEPFGAPEAETTLDTRAPTSQVNPLPPILHVNVFTVSWTGQDTGSGIQYYDVRYRINGGDWVMWLAQTTLTSVDITNAQEGIYGFEVRAVDHLGHIESFQGQPEATTIVDTAPPFVEPRLWLPLVGR
jgi:hypothetical protein